MLTARNPLKSPAIALCILSKGWIAVAPTERHSGDPAGQWCEVIHKLSTDLFTAYSAGMKKPPESVDSEGIFAARFQKARRTGKD